MRLEGITGVTAGPPVTGQSLRLAENRLGVNLPDQVRSMFLSGDGRYDYDGECWLLWPLDRLIDDNLVAWDESGLPRSLLAIDDDGTGDPFCVVLDDQGSDHVFRWSWIAGDLEVDEGTWHDFSQEWLSSTPPQSS
jgi:hypothetical protein